MTAQLQLPVKRASQLAGPDMLLISSRNCGQVKLQLSCLPSEFSGFQEIWTVPEVGSMRCTTARYQLTGGWQ